VGEKALDVVCLGACAIDRIVIVDKFPYHEGTSVVKAEYLREGGTSANVAVCLSHLSARCGIISVIGDDPEGLWILSRLGEEGVDTSRIIIRKGRKSPSLVIVVDEEQRRAFILFNKDTLSLEPSEVDVDYVATAKVFFTDTYLADTALWAMEEAKRRGLKIACSIPQRLEVMSIWGLTREEIFRALELSDLAMPSKECALALVGTDDPLTATRQLASSYPDKVICVTVGKEGSYVAYRGRILKVPAFEVKVVDTTGAGDTYMGAMIYGLMVKGLSLEDAAKLASTAASLKCSRPGAWSSPKLAEVEEALRKRPLEVRYVE